MNLSKGQNYILNIIKKNTGLGKTALMKELFLFQEVMGAKTGYNFSIYTYGPYDSDVMEDIDQLCAFKLVDCSVYRFQTYIGYSLNVTNEGENALKALSPEEEQNLNNIVCFAKNKTAKELELYSTIVYVGKLYKKNFWPSDDCSIIQQVHEIKPHFSQNTISDAYEELRRNNYI